VDELEVAEPGESPVAAVGVAQEEVEVPLVEVEAGQGPASDLKEVEGAGAEGLV
jgi:hypothetical protein